MAQDQDGPAGRQRGSDDSFTGRSAQLAVMGELLRRRCNTAVPQIDLGTDVLAFRDDREEIARLQVKACTVPYIYKDGSGYSARFALPRRQLLATNRPVLHYVLAVMRDGNWVDCLIVGRGELQTYREAEGKFGHDNEKTDETEITVEIRARVMCSGRDLSRHRNAWELLPPFRSGTIAIPAIVQEATRSGGLFDDLPPSTSSGAG